ncbi:hypothetical protein MY8738_004418 [Beauveria namnaoensis]
MKRHSTETEAALALWVPFGYRSLQFVAPRAFWDCTFDIVNLRGQLRLQDDKSIHWQECLA